MRKDAKIGFAIGGVLLAVLTVYAIVVPKHKKTNSTVAVITPPPADLSPATPGPTMIASGVGPDVAPISPMPAPSAPVVDAQQTVPAAPLLDPAKATPPLRVDAGNTDDQKTPGIVADNGPIVPAPPAESHIKPNKVKSLQLDVPEAPSAGSDRVYVVQAGQTLSSIANDIYGNPRFWVAIQRENKAINANHLKVGQKISLPDITPIRPGAVEEVTPPESVITASHVVEASIETGSTHGSYVVKPGDSLYKIARTVLGSGRKAEALYALNKDIIGSDKTRLKLGTILKLPEVANTRLASSRSMH